MVASWNNYPTSVCVYRAPLGTICVLTQSSLVHLMCAFNIQTFSCVHTTSTLQDTLFFQLPEMITTSHKNRSQLLP